MKWRPNGTQWVNSEGEIYQRKTKVLDLHRWDHSRLQHLLQEQKPEFLQHPHTKRTENGPKMKLSENPYQIPCPILSFHTFRPSKTNPSPEPGRIQKPVDARAGVSKVGKDKRSHGRSTLFQSCFGVLTTQR